MASVTFRCVEKSFGAVAVLRGLDLNIDDGEFFTFVGPSGCGKSTVLNLVAGLEEPTSGDILIDGESVAGVSPAGRDVAMVFQSYALYPHMTVFENMAFPLRVRREGGAEIERRVKEAARTLGLDGLLSRFPRELSGGQRQRVALGRAIVRRPRVFLMDEPLSNLDAGLRVEMRTELKRLHRELGVTTLYVTHDQEEAMSLSDRLAILLDGELRQCGPPMEVYDRPADTFAARFIGSPSMNFFDAVVRSRSAGAGRCALEIEALGSLHRVEAGDEAVAALETGAGILVGVRPADMEVAQRLTGGSVEAVVEVTEPVGSLQWVDVAAAGARLKCAAPARLRLEPGARVSLRDFWQKAHFFDPSTGKRLRRPAA
ncbi:MAG TPA: ABC transporter ATP-binding protein [Deltaproteobacteria bacterium]|nr:ABC transporter ATP-binding protein [Deltaproteobacteria bacterium]